MPKKSAKKNWKSTSGEVKSKHKTRLALMVLAGVIAIIILGQAVKFIANFYSPLTKSSTTHILWDKNEPINIVIAESDTAVLSLDPNKKEVLLVKIPEDISNNLLGESLVRQVSRNLGVPITGYLEVSGDYRESTSEKLVEKLRANLFEWILIYPSLKSNLSPSELVDLAIILSKVRFDKIATLELPEDLDKNDIDLKTSQKFIDSQVREDSATIAIFNATSEPGLANIAARVVNNLGGNVIFVTNAKSETLKKSYVYIKNEAPDYSTSRFARIFSPNCYKSTKCDILEDSDITSSRAQINIVLGQDFVGKY